MVVRQDTPVNNLTFAEARKLLMGDRQYWSSNLRVVLLIHAPSARERQVVLKTMYGMSEAQFRQYWISKVFRLEATTGPKIVFSNEMAIELVGAIPGAVVVVDHRLRIVRVLNNAFLIAGDDPDKVYDRVQQRMCEILGRLKAPTNMPPLPVDCPRTPLVPQSSINRDEFEQLVRQTKDYINRGDIFQLVLSRRFEVDFDKDALALYRCLRFVNPSPYMFCLNFAGEFSLVGSSPEMHVRVVDGLVEIRPIAGTRQRGRTPDEDERNAADLLADAKERAEHVMLLDLARNDLGRIAEFGSVRVTEQMGIERYSHVMHIVSHVVARLRTGQDAYDVLRATFPAGTVSGAPKVRAMQLISDLEKRKRGCYAGAVGYFGFDGNLDSCIALRSVVLKNGRAYIQAGAGIVADSVPAAEYDETENKAAAMMQALNMARAS